MFHTSRLKSSRLTILLIVALVVTVLGQAPVHAKTTVTYWTWNAAGFDTQPNGTPGPQKKAFDAANPDIDLQVKIYSYSDYLNQLQLNMASGSGPDLVAVQAGGLLHKDQKFFLDLFPPVTNTAGDKCAASLQSPRLDLTRTKKVSNLV